MSSHSDPLTHMSVAELTQYAREYDLTEDDVLSKIKDIPKIHGRIDLAEENRIWRLHHTCRAIKQTLTMNDRVFRNIEYLRKKYRMDKLELFNKITDRTGVYLLEKEFHGKQDVMWSNFNEICAVADVLGVDGYTLMWVEIEQMDKTFL